MYCYLRLLSGCGESPVPPTAALDRVLPFDMAYTKAYAELLAWRSKQPMPSLRLSPLPMDFLLPPVTPRLLRQPD